MRPACACLTLALSGCAAVLGIDDPDTEHRVSPSITGRYVLSIDVRTDGAFSDTLIFEADVAVDAAARTMAWDLVAVDHTTREPLDAEVSFATELENLPELDFAIDDFDLDLPGEATAAGSPITIAGTLDGIFPIIVAEDGPIDDGFCGGVDGQITSNKEILSGTTFAAARLEGGAGIPAAVETSCATLVDPNVP